MNMNIMKKLFSSFLGVHKKSYQSNLSLDTAPLAAICPCLLKLLRSPWRLLVVFQKRLAQAHFPPKLTKWVRIVPLRGTQVRSVSLKKSLLRISTKRDSDRERPTVININHSLCWFYDQLVLLSELIPSEGKQVDGSEEALVISLFIKRYHSVSLEVHQ